MKSNYLLHLISVFLFLTGAFMLTGCGDGPIEIRLGEFQYEMRDANEELITSDFTRRADHYIGVNSGGQFITVLNLGAPADSVNRPGLNLRIIILAPIEAPGTWRITTAGIANAGNNLAYALGTFTLPLAATQGIRRNLSIASFDNPVSVSHVTVTAIEGDEIVGTFRFFGAIQQPLQGGGVATVENIEMEGTFRCPRSSTVL